MKRKLSCLLLFALLTQTILVVPTVSCYQTSLQTPPVPTFSIRILDSSMHITVKNQPYQAGIDVIQGTFTYDVRVKGHFSMDWERPNIESNPSTPPEDGSGYTYLILSIGQYPANAQIDVQVEAVYVAAINVGQSTNEWITQRSGWSSTQTVTIPSTTFLTPYTPSATPYSDPFRPSTETTTNNPQPNGDNWNQLSIVLMIIAVIVVVDGLVLSAFLVKKRHKKQSKT